MPRATFDPRARLAALVQALVLACGPSESASESSEAGSGTSSSGVASTGEPAETEESPSTGVTPPGESSESETTGERSESSESSSGSSDETAATDDCPEQGGITYVIVREPAPTPEQEAAYALIESAMTEAVTRYNCYTNIEKALSVTFNPQVPTADGNVNGSIRFGSMASMNSITAMHEISHTVGVGSYEFAARVVDGIFTGASATARLRAITGDPNDELHADTQHFWPYGLNYVSEVMSDADLVHHCEIVVGIREDIGY